MDIFKDVKRLLNVQTGVLLISLAISILRYLDMLPELLYLISLMLIATECCYVIIKSTEKNPYRKFSKKETEYVEWIVNLTSIAITILCISVVFHAW